jgi:steroid delta-isomerase-like uncharacterized protein
MQALCRAWAEEELQVSEDENKAIVRRLVERCWNAGDLAALDEIVSAEYEQQNASVPAGREGLRQLITKTRSAFPDLTVHVDALIAEDDRVVALSTGRGTHQGEFSGIEATGKPVEVGSIDVYRVKNGQIVGHVGRLDELGLLDQIGITHDLSWQR